jgi:predicted nucleotidyltransferase
MPPTISPCANLETEIISRLDFLGETALNSSTIKAFTLLKEGKERIINTLKGVLSREDKVVLAFLYGSFLCEGPFRDIDIGVFVEDPSILSPLYEMELEVKLEEAIDRAFPIDARVINKAPLIFAYQVIQGKLLLCRDANLFANFVTTIARKYQDIQPLLSYYAKEAYGSSD